MFDPTNDPSENLPYRLTLSYISALVIIATLTIFMGFFLFRANQDNQRAIDLINMAGRQRMLVQKTGWMALEYVHADATTEADIRTRIDRTLNLVRDNHDYLASQIAPGFGGDPMGSLLLDQYFSNEGVAPLHDKFRDAARNLTRSKTQAEKTQFYQEITKQTRPLMEKLDLIVTAHQENSRLRLVALGKTSFWIEMFLLLVITVLGIFVFRPVVRRVAESQEKLRSIAHTDPLTGLLNRRTFMQISEKITMTCRRLKSSCSALFIDIDHFKNINDTYGHSTGDDVLVRVGQAITSALRGGDVVGRIGGEEFVVILPDADEKHAALVGERIRHIISSLDMTANGTNISVTCSIGAAEIRSDDKDVAETMMRADYAMYQAKQQGRNRVIQYGVTDI